MEYINYETVQTKYNNCDKIVKILNNIIFKHAVKISKHEIIDRCKVKRSFFELQLGIREPQTEFLFKAVLYFEGKRLFG